VEIYHTLNRGVDKRNIFLDEQDHFRFIHDLFEFNDTKPANTTYWDFKKFRDSGFNDFASRSTERKARKLLVSIHAFCLMPNHYHLLLTPRISDGITKFMKKLNIGYAKYFNEKYKRNGALFEGRYKSIRIVDEVHFSHIPQYIHFNPLDLVAPEWRNNQLTDYQKTITFLGSYRWSSFLDYIGKNNFSSITNRRFLLECFGGSKRYKLDIEKNLKELNLENIGKLTLES
jgi:putative transposase